MMDELSVVFFCFFLSFSLINLEIKKKNTENYRRFRVTMFRRRTPKRLPPSRRRRRPVRRHRDVATPNHETRRNPNPIIKLKSIHFSFFPLFLSLSLSIVLLNLIFFLSFISIVIRTPEIHAITILINLD